MAVAPDGEMSALGNHVNTLLMGRRKDWIGEISPVATAPVLDWEKIVQGETR
jgi:hypothetical protein